MLTISDTLAGHRIQFHLVEDEYDIRKVFSFASRHSALGIDTESTGLNPYQRGWKLRTVQIANDVHSFVIPARWRTSIGKLMELDINWIGHNGPHDIRCIDQHLGYNTGVVCAGETYIASHHLDSRKQEEGGVGHGLKEMACAHIDRNAGKWEVALKREFKLIEISMPGQFYKSGPRKGQQRVRKAKLAEGWSLIDPRNPAYVAYAAADPLLTYHLWRFLQPIVRQFYDLYKFDLRVQQAGDKLTRRAMLLDVPYTEKLGIAFTRKSERMQRRAREFGCDNIHSGKQIAETLLAMGAELRETTPTGAYKTDDSVMRGLMAAHDGDVREFIRCVLIAKQLLKRREAYTSAMLREMDANGRIHPSINTLGARTTRMSVSRPALQQLPTKDRDDEN